MRKVVLSLLLCALLFPAYADGSLNSLAVVGETVHEAVRIIFSLTVIISLLFLVILRMKLKHKAISVLTYLIILFSFYFTYSLSAPPGYAYRYAEDTSSIWTPLTLLACVAALLIFAHLDLRDHSPKLYSRMLMYYHKAYYPGENSGDEDEKN